MHSQTSLSDQYKLLCNAPLYNFQDLDWQDWYPQMAAFLSDPDTTRREGAVERLMMATFSAENSGNARTPANQQRFMDRAHWCLAEFEAAHTQYADIIPFALRNFRWHGHKQPYAQIVRTWLDALAQQSNTSIDPGLITGAQIMITPARADDQANIAQWLLQLDDPSQWVRGCAAERLASFMEEGTGDLTGDQLVALIREKEIIRPGIAGPFWSEKVVVWPEDDPWSATVLADWMLDVLEERCGKPEGEMPFNDIDFHLHELCRSEPDRVRRMIDSGFLDLALMTATEDDPPIEAMAPLLRELASVEDAAIAARAAAFLACWF
jgi:hypothetical protein